MYTLSIYLLSSTDILVWTNENVIQWLDSVGMEEYTLNLLHSGVHGGIVALDNTFDFEKLVMALQIPTSNTAVRILYDKEFVYNRCHCIVS